MRGLGGIGHDGAVSDPTRPIDQSYGRANAPRPSVDATRLWVGGLLAGVVAAGVAIVGLLIARGIFDINVFVPGRQDALFTPSSWWYAGAAFIGGVFATGLLHLLLVANAPAPFRFFSWILGLIIAIPAMIFWRHFRALIDSFVIDMEQQAVKLVEVAHGDRRG